MQDLGSSRKRRPRLRGGSQSHSVDDSSSCVTNPEIIISEEGEGGGAANALEETTLSEDRDLNLIKESNSGGGKGGKMSKGLKKTKSKVCNVL